MGLFRRSSAGAGSAPTPAITFERRCDRAVDELIGLSRGLLADGHLDRREAQFLHDWLSARSEFAQQWPFSAIFQRLYDALADGVLDDEEERDLMQLLLRLHGNPDSPASPAVPGSSALPVDDPAPSIAFPSSVFVITGVFEFGPRALVSTEIERRGGLIRTSVSAKTRYVVVGTLGSDDWIHSSFGRKIETAMRLRADGLPVSVVSERHWASSLG